MARVTVDFSDVQDMEPLEKGEYSGTISEANYVAPATDDKHPYINLVIEVNEPGYEGRRVWHNWSFSPKALWRMKGDMENLGLVTDEEEIEIDVDEDSEPQQVTSPELVGLPVVVVMDKPRTYEGRLQNNSSMLRLPDDAVKKSGGKKAPAKAGGKRKFK